MDINLRRVKTIEEMRGIVEGGGVLECRALDRESACEFIGWVLDRFGYRRLGRAEKGVLRDFIQFVTGLSTAQMGRRIRQYAETGRVRDLRASNSGRPFERVYTRADIAFGRMSGKAMAHVFRRQFNEFGKAEYERLASISASHIHNLRRSRTYTSKHTTPDRTRPVANQIGERGAPDPNGEPGYLRVDTVHQGDLNRVKGVYIINLVDTVTQFEFVGSVPTISENHTIPVLGDLIDLFPFVIRGFHSDNGSEFINRRVAAMLSRLDAEFTKSRPRHSNDNGLVESKNGSVIRAHLGHEHIPAGRAGLVHEFTRDILSPFLNFHRPCLFPEPRTDARGKTRRHYPASLVATPYEALRRIPDAARFLKPGVTFEQLDAEARAEIDIEAAGRVARERAALFRKLFSGRVA